MRKITISDILTEGEIRTAMRLEDAKAICERLVRPNIHRINAKLGQENDPMYLAYLVSYMIELNTKRK